MGTGPENRQIVEEYWHHYFQRDWKRVARFFTKDAHYTDVGVDPIGATGPAEILARLMSAVNAAEGFDHRPRHIIAEGRVVMTEHVEIWRFPSRAPFEYPFVSVMEIHDGKISRWHDYGAPNLFVEHTPPEWLQMASKWRSRPIVPLHELFPGEGFEQT